MKNLFTLIFATLLCIQMQAQIEPAVMHCPLDGQSAGESFVSGLDNIDFFSEAACNPLLMHCNFVFLTRDDGTGAYPAGMLDWVTGSMNNRLANIRDDDGCSSDPNYPHDANIKFETEMHYIADTEAWDWHGRAQAMGNYGSYDFCPDYIDTNWPYLYNNVIATFNAAHPDEFNFFFVENGTHLDFIEDAIASGVPPAAPWNDPDNFGIFSGCSRLAGNYDQDYPQFIIMANQWTEYTARVNFGQIYYPGFNVDNQTLANWHYWGTPDLANHELGHTIMDQYHTCGCNNLMTGGGCAWNPNNSYLTKAQLNRLHNTLATSNLHDFVDCSSVNEGSCDIFVTGNEVLNDNMTVFGDLIIQSGAELTITSMVELSETSDIQLEAGAKLIVDGGILTNGCGSTWRGIRVTGGNSDFDVKITNGAIVENTAGAAVSMFPPLPWPQMTQHGNGILHADNSFFVNTKRIVELISFQAAFNSSYVRDCVQDGGKWSVTNWNCIGVEVLDNVFNNISRSCIVTSSGAMDIIGNEFNSVENDILFSNVHPSIGSYMAENTFNSNDTGIRSLGSSWAQNHIEENQFFTGDHDIFMDGVNNYLINDNDFTGNIGVVSMDNGGDGNEVISNQFSGNIVGIMPGGTNDGYVFLDNCFSTALADANIFGSVAEFIGNGSFNNEPANNCFTHGGTNTNAMDIAGNPDFFHYIEPNDNEVDCRDAMNAVPNVDRIMMGDVDPPSGCGTDGFATPTPSFNPCHPKKTKQQSFQAYNWLMAKINEIQNDQSLTPLQKQYFTSIYKRCLIRVYYQIFELYLIAQEYETAREFIKVQPSEDPDPIRVAVYTSYVYEKNYQKAAQYLGTMEGESEKLLDFKKIQEIDLERLNNLMTYEPGGQTLNTIKTIATKSHPYAGYAKALYFALTEVVLESDLPKMPKPGGGEKSAAPTIYTDSGIKVYPNPFNTELNVSVKGYENLQLEVYDLFGKLIYSQAVFEGNEDINTSDWSNGIYVVTLMQNDELIHQDKLILIK